MQVSVLRYAGPDFSHDTPDAWRENAACMGESPDLFEIIPVGRVTDALDIKQIIQTNEETLALAKAVCAKCTVRAECLRDANEDDLKWTVRGGLTPASHNTNGSGRPPKAATDPCQHGHVDWKTTSRGYKECNTCTKERNRVRAAEARRKAGASKLTSIEENHILKGLDHEPVIGIRSNGRRECRTCRNQRQRAKLGLNPFRTVEQRHVEEHSDHEPDWILVGKAKDKRCRECTRQYKVASRARLG